MNKKLFIRLWFWKYRLPHFSVLILLLLFPLFLFVRTVHAQQAAAPGAYRLIGTVEGGKGFTGAVMDDGSGSQTFYHVRERLPDGSQIVSVDSDNIRIRRSDGSSYQLFVRQAGTPGGQPPPKTGNARPEAPAAPPPAVTPAPAQPPAVTRAPTTPISPQRPPTQRPPRNVRHRSEWEEK